MSHEDQMSELNVWGCTGNLAHTQHLIEKGGVLEMFCRINLDYLKGYTVTGVTHGHDGHIQPREWVLGLSGMSLRYLLCTRPLEAVTKLEPFWPVTPEPAPQRQSERTFMTLTHPLGRARFASEGGGPNEDRPDPPPSKPNDELAL